VRSAFLACVVACSPAASPKPVAAELVVPPIVDGGAGVAPAFDSPEMRAECRALVWHLTEVQLESSEASADERATLLEAVLLSFETMTGCPAADPGARKCFFAANTTPEVDACIAAFAHTEPPPVITPPRSP